MENFNALIAKAAHTPERLDEDDIAALRRLARDYPASALAPALLLKWADGHLSDSEREAYRHRVALTSGDRVALINYIDPDGAGFDSFYPTQPVVSKPATANAIDIFLETYGHRTAEEDALLERMIFNPVPEYTLEDVKGHSETSKGNGEEDVLSRQDELIDAFLASSRDIDDGEEVSGVDIEAGDTERPTRNTSDNPLQSTMNSPSQGQGLLSESLAKIFIKQGRYERAYEIISNLNLNYPEKSIYFADQLRFLRKLMINQRYAPKSQK